MSRLTKVVDGFGCPECGCVHATLAALKVNESGAACAGCGASVELPADVKLSRLRDGAGESTPGHVVAAAEFLAFVEGLRTTEAVAVLGIPPVCLAGNLVVTKTAEHGGGIAILTATGRLALDTRDALNLLLLLARALLPLSPPFDVLAKKIEITR